ncbi:NAD(P)-dependent alcohol dehydrogenase [Agromyces sp. Marseille-P2726]|uniref:NAD(P)-dependent alcohol dehydrogenase n=1 Tax=Agromyces sp. Marseille-P2726 TaxID=2709132 RepID=UPI0020C3FF47|nr:NAD(P)-dependent alcohol dehydrogenase [Agromyces sp. Marseille-P2726]
MTTTGVQGTRMRAAVARRFGAPEVVQVEEVPKPTPKPDELLVRVHASTVSIADHRLRTRDVPDGLGFLIPLSLGVFRPRKRVLGMDVAGVVESVGGAVTGFAPGDEVIAMLGGSFGGHAEYVRVPVSKAIAPKPSSLSMEEAVALVFGGHTALAFLAHVEISSGTEVLVNGASGAVGSAVVQLAKLRGARVTAVCSGTNADLVRSLGADRVIDYTIDDFAANGETYDVIVDCVGNAPFERVEGSIEPGGALLLVITDLKGVLSAKRHSRRSGKLVTMKLAPVSSEDFAEFARFAESGAFRPVIDRVYDLDDVAEAHRYVDTGRKRGNVVLRIA